MRMRFVVCLMAVLSLIPLARAQISEFPPCSQSELAYVLELQGAYDALVDSLTTGLESSLAYSAAQIEWREHLWSGLPPCAEAIEVAVLMSQIANDRGALTALNYSGVSLSLNRYKDRLHFEGNLRDRLNSRLEAIAALIESGERPTAPAPGERQLAACAGEEIQLLHDALRENEDLIASALEIRSRGDLLDYINQKLAWRDQAWEDLPPCGESVEIGPLMIQVANDFATGLAYRYADVPKDQNPVDGTLQVELVQLGDWLGAMLEEMSVDIKTVAAEALLDLERCSKGAIAELFVRLYGFNDLLEIAFDIKNFEDYMEFVAAHIAWRDQLFSEMPLCAESVASSTLVANFASDFSALFALSFAGIEAEENPYWDEVDANMALVHETLVAFPDYAEDAVQIPGFVDSLPACTAAERGEMAATVEDNRYAFAHLASEIETQDDLLSYSDLQRRWREIALSELPPCQDAIQAGLLLMQLTGDTVAMTAMKLFVGLPVAQNPYWDEIRVAREAIMAIVADAGGE